MESSAKVGAAAVADKGLKKNAVSYVASIVIGVASTAPGYSLAAVLGFAILAGGGAGALSSQAVGFQAPAILIISFVPMLFFDSLAVLGLMIAFYLGLNGVACVLYYRREIFNYRREIFKPAKNFLFVCVAPLIGSAILFYPLGKNAVDLADPANSESGDSWLGLGPPLVIAIFFLILGIILMAATQIHSSDFFKRKTETAPEGFLEEA